jgi:hypothetical protein
MWAAGAGIGSPKDVPGAIRCLLLCDIAHAGVLSPEVE